MAAKKKSKAQPAPRKPIQKTAQKNAPIEKKSAGAAKSAKAPRNVAKPTKPAKKGATSATPVKSAKVAAPAKAVKNAKAAAPAKVVKNAKALEKTKPADKDARGSSIMKAAKKAASKVKQVAAAAAVKLIDPDAGKPAPDFDLSDEKGERVTSESLAGKPYLLYFYPKDDTPGCTKEACDIRDNFARFGQQGLRVLGVSPDSTQSHAKFGQKYGLPFTLLSDPDKQLASAYGVWGKKQLYGRESMGIIRSSFLIGSDGTIKKSYRGVRVDGHVDAVLSDAQTLL